MSFGGKYTALVLNQETLWRSAILLLREESVFNRLLGLGFVNLIRALKLGIQMLDDSPAEWQLPVLQSSSASHLSMELFQGYSMC